MTQEFWIIICLLISSIVFVTCAFLYKMTFQKPKVIDIITFIETNNRCEPEIIANFFENVTKRIINFNKLIIAFLVITFIVILLILRIISPESGLPIITAIIGYVLADNSTMRNSNNRNSKVRD